MTSAADVEERIFGTLKGKYKHYCPDWDFMAIDETLPEFEACTCFEEQNDRDLVDLRHPFQSL